MFQLKKTFEFNCKLSLEAGKLSSVILLFLILSFNHILSFSQNCDSSLVVDKDLPYGYKSFKNRCEGFYKRQVFRSDRIDLIGLTLGKLYFSEDSNEVITLLSGIKDSSRMKVQVKAQTVALKSYYRMDTNFFPEDSVQWPVKDVLFPNYLTPEKIRVMGWIEEDGISKYIPLVTKSKLRKIINDQAIHLTFRPSVNVENIQYVIYNYQTNKSTDWQSASISKCRSGVPINLLLNLEPGSYRVTLSAIFSGSKEEYLESQADFKF